MLSSESSRVVVIEGTVSASQSANEGKTKLITSGSQRSPTWEIVGDQTLGDEALDAIACLLLEYFNTDCSRNEVNDPPSASQNDLEGN